MLGQDLCPVVIDLVDRGTRALPERNVRVIPVPIAVAPENQRCSCASGFKTEASPAAAPQAAMLPTASDRAPA